MGKSKLQVNLEFGAARLLLMAFQLLPLRLGLIVGPVLGRGGFYLSRRLRRTGERNLELAFPDMDNKERRRLLKGFFANLGRQLAVFSKFKAANDGEIKRIIECQ